MTGRDAVGLLDIVGLTGAISWAARWGALILPIHNTRSP
jgi:hypothetical protein